MFVDLVTTLQTKDYSSTLSKIETRIKNVIFDIGGVLLHWNPVDLVTATFGYKNQGILDIIHSETWKRLDNGTLNNSEALYSVPEKLRSDFALFLQEFTKHMFIIQKGVEMVKYCKSKGVRLYILSNFHLDGFKAIETMPIFKEFDGFVISSHVKVNKPEKGIYMALLGKYHLDPCESIFIDDKLENVEASIDLGMHGILCEDHEKAFSILRSLI
jgi:HAD superfamily hydrolase (TIGR01509 family)